MGLHLNVMKFCIKWKKLFASVKRNDDIANWSFSKSLPLSTLAPLRCKHKLILLMYLLVTTRSNKHAYQATRKHSFAVIVSHTIPTYPAVHELCTYKPFVQNAPEKPCPLMKLFHCQCFARPCLCLHPAAQLFLITHVVVYRSGCRYLLFSIHFSKFMSIYFTRKRTKCSKVRLLLGAQSINTERVSLIFVDNVQNSACQHE